MEPMLPVPGDALPFGVPFTAAQALRRGVTRTQLYRLADEGVLRRVFRGVYVDSAADDDLLMRARALSLVVPPTAVVADESAAWARGIDLVARGEQVVPPPVSIVQPLDRTRVRKPGADGARRLLLSRDVELLNGVRVTTSLRTALDLARTRSRARGIAALDAMLRTGDFTHEQLLREVWRFRGYRGVVRLRTLAPLADPRAESPAESVLRLLWLDAGLPTPTLQIPTTDDEGWERYRLDLGLPHLRYAAEYDGAAWHGSPAQRARDRRRRAWLRDARGWTVDVLTSEELFHHPSRGVEILRAGIARAERNLRRTA
ncbi:MAG: type IV toxin-antitoxin system AbiEi family antitoxin domain-containing protein [Nocardioides sp.]